jgi:hypothetical protein
MRRAIGDALARGSGVALVPGRAGAGRVRSPVRCSNRPRSQGHQEPGDARDNQPKASGRQKLSSRHSARHLVTVPFRAEVAMDDWSQQRLDGRRATVKMVIHTPPLDSRRILPDLARATSGCRKAVRDDIARLRSAPHHEPVVTSLARLLPDASCIQSSHLNRGWAGDPPAGEQRLVHGVPGGVEVGHARGAWPRRDGYDRVVASLSVQISGR